MIWWNRFSTTVQTSCSSRPRAGSFLIAHGAFASTYSFAASAKVMTSRVASRYSHAS